MVFGLIALAMAGMQPVQDAPPVMVPLVAPSAIEGAPLRQPPERGYLCSAGFGDCLRIIPNGNDNHAQLALFDMDAAASSSIEVALPWDIGADDGQDLAIWDQAIRLPSVGEASSGIRAYLVGVIRRTPVGYSGGFASAERLHLFQLMIGHGDAWLGPELVSLPWAAQAEIRACFGEDDAERRRGACHDIYRYVPALSVAGEQDRASDGDYPTLRYTTVSTAYPRTARRSEDSSAAPPLSEADLSEWRDPECSYTRTLRYNPATLRYEMDRTAPDCGAYTNP